MPSLWDATYVVTDVETTGSDPSAHRIIEIACVVVRGGEIAERVHSLVNPHQFVPPFIEQLTGIGNADVVAAPEESSVMPLVEQLLRQPSAVFVAHQEVFDWRFVEQALRRCGIVPPDVPRLCTLRLARRLLPADGKKNLGALAEYFGIAIEDRHRAHGDAEATAQILLRLLDEAERRGIETVEELLAFQHQRLPQRRLPKRVLDVLIPSLDALPRYPGVYAMYDGSGAVLYVGKAKVLADRVRSYFQPGTSLAPHIEQMIRQVRRIEWEETPTELSALLLEAQRIKQWQPPFNVLHRRTRRYPFLRLTDDAFPRLELVTEHDGTGEFFGPFPHRGMAEQLRDLIDENFTLRRCSGTIEPSPSARPCFYYHLRRCGAPCAALQSAQEYAAEVERVRRLLHGNADWLVAQLENRMHAAAEQLDFETAALLRGRVRELSKLVGCTPAHSASVSRFDLVMAIPTAYEEATVEVFVFVGGKLAVQRVAGRRDSFEWLVELLDEVAVADRGELSAWDVAALRIVTSWMYHNTSGYVAVPLGEHVTPRQTIERLRRILAGRGDDAPETVRMYVPIEDV
jgi:DNA polymerase-3 subunit epsilon